MKNLTSKIWWGAALVRAIKTAAQAAVAGFAVDTAAPSLWETPWAAIFGIAGAAALVSLLTSLAGLPEVDQQRNEAP